VAKTADKTWIYRSSWDNRLDAAIDEVVAVVSKSKGKIIQFQVLTNSRPDAFCVVILAEGGEEPE
jgi:hypothetical protein